MTHIASLARLNPGSTLVPGIYIGKLRGGHSGSNTEKRRQAARPPAEPDAALGCGSAPRNGGQRHQVLCSETNANSWRLFPTMNAKL